MLAESLKALILLALETQGILWRSRDGTMSKGLMSFVFWISRRVVMGVD
jgi:hypothetical protein